MNKFRKLTVTALLIVSALAAGSASAKVNEYEGQHRNAAGDPTQWDEVAGDPSQWISGDPSQWLGDPSQWLGDPSQWGKVTVVFLGDPSQWGKVSMQDFHFSIK